MENGKEKAAALDFTLSELEKKWVAQAHRHHKQCDLDKCAMHSFTHIAIRLESGLRRAAWARVHENHYGPETCPDPRHSWSAQQWIKELLLELEELL